MIKSVNELGKYKVGDTAWTIINKNDLSFSCDVEDLWLCGEHPIVAKKRGKLKVKYLPRLGCESTFIVQALNWDPKIVKFHVSGVRRSSNSGTYYYYQVVGDETTVLHEYSLFDSKESAQLELDKIYKNLRAKFS